MNTLKLKENDPAIEQVFYENEIKANLLVGKFLIVCTVIFFLVWVLNSVGVFAIRSIYVLRIFAVGFPMLIIPATICLVFRGRKKWIKYVTLLSFIILLAYLDSILSYNVTIFIVIPVIFSCWYYSGGFTLKIALFSTVAFAISAYCGAYFYYYDKPDMNFVADSLNVYIHDVMLQSFLPRWILFLLVTAVCCVIAGLGRKMVLQQDAVSQANARVETELEMANRIQTQALPSAEKLSGCPCRVFDLAAKMLPAKEVGGDFYDFFYVDPTHLALIIADVSDKGIAAALYMMMSKLMLDNKLTVCTSPGLVLEDVNRQLREKSLKGMFVTVWLGILDLETGDLISANAGHEYPVIKRAGGDFEIIKDRHGFVLGGMSGMKYRETALHLEEGDVLFVYTDGVPEANDPDGQLFGTARMLESLNSHKDCTMEELIDAVKKDIDLFAAEAPQFDDTTMLALRFLSPADGSITVKPDMEELDAVQDYMGSVMSRTAIPPLQAKKISICVDEMFSNIVHYSSATAVQVSCTSDENRLKIIFRDDGIPFDPLSQDEPDLRNTSGERKGGGLGIFITGKYMDSMEYARSDGKNVLTLISNIP